MHGGTVTRGLVRGAAGSDRPVLARRRRRVRSQLQRNGTTRARKGNHGRVRQSPQETGERSQDRAGTSTKTGPGTAPSILGEERQIDVSSQENPLRVTCTGKNGLATRPDHPPIRLAIGGGNGERERQREHATPQQQWASLPALRAMGQLAVTFGDWEVVALSCASCGLLLQASEAATL